MGLHFAMNFKGRQLWTHYGRMYCVWQQETYVESKMKTTVVGQIIYDTATTLTEILDLI